MWDRLLIDCNIATMDPAIAGPFGAIEDGAIAIQDGRIIRVGRRVELAGMRAHKIERLGGAWITPGLVDCHTHLVFGGNRAAEFEQRLNGATYEEIARAGGGIASTVKATRSASSGELIAAARTPAAGADARRRDDDRDQVRLRARHAERAQDAECGEGPRRERTGAGRAHVTSAACAPARI
jgi:imidazolonepropionase